jgi:hypothetical protein
MIRTVDQYSSVKKSIAFGKSFPVIIITFVYQYIYVQYVYLLASLSFDYSFQVQYQLMFCLFVELNIFSCNVYHVYIIQRNWLKVSFNLAMSFPFVWL